MMNNKFEVVFMKKYSFIKEFWSWSEKHKFSKIDADLLPEMVAVCRKGDVSVYCCWIWKTDSKVIIPTYFMSNPDFKDRKGGLEALISDMILHAKHHDKAKMIFVPTSSDVIANKLLKLGFVSGDEGGCQYFGHL